MNISFPVVHERNPVMKRILLTAAAVAALAFGGLFASTAQAHGPHGYGCRHGYGGGYGGYGYGGYGYGPYTVGGPRFVPYGAGYSGGWQPYQGFGYQQPRFGLYMGF